MRVLRAVQVLTLCKRPPPTHTMLSLLLGHQTAGCLRTSTPHKAVSEGVLSCMDAEGAGAMWLQEKARMDELKALHKKREELNIRLEQAENRMDLAMAADIKYGESRLMSWLSQHAL